MEHPVCVPLDIGQPNPLVIHAGVIVQLRQCNFMIHASVKSSPVHLSMEVLAPEVATGVTEAELKLLSSE